jgi:hypothetical protein
MLKGIRTVLAAAVALALLAGCASKTSFQHDRMERVAVLSLMGDEVGVFYQGVTTFGNETSEVDVSKTGLDQAYRSRIEETLKRDFDYQVVPVDYDRQAWLRVTETAPETSVSGILFGEDLYGKYSALVTALAQDNQLDAVLLLIPQPAYTGRVVKPEGLGVYTGGRSGNIRFAIAGIFAEMVLFNGEDGSDVEAARLQERATVEGAVTGFFDTSLFQRRPIRDLKGTDSFFIAKVEPTELRELTLGRLFKDLMRDPYLADTVEDVMTPDW